MRKNFLQASVLVVLLGACTSMNVQTLSPQVQINHVCIINNPKVTIDDFLPALQARLRHHGINSNIIHSSESQSCTHTLTYVARRSWDFTTYLSEVDLVLLAQNKKIAALSFKQGSGSLTKWGTTAARLNPLVDEMLGKTKQSTQINQTINKPSFDATSTPNLNTEKTLIPLPGQ